MRSMFVGALLIAGLLPACHSQGPKEQQAIAAANAWLAITDSGDHARGWNEAAAFFKGAVPKDAWVTAATGVRAPLGSVGKRELKSASYSTSLPGAPDGEYVVIQFTTQFANKEGAIETITPMLEPDGSWRVSGYFIK